MLLHFSHLLFYIFIGGADTTAQLFKSGAVR